MAMASTLFNYGRLLLMPGFDLFTRRRVRLKKYWRTGPRRVLDAGSGNGWFSYLAYRSGATVSAVNVSPEQVEKARQFYNEWLKVPTDRLRFNLLNVYELDTLDGTFDEIICYETLEHIKGDSEVCAAFFRKLNPGGALHLCCPFAEHPKWRSEPLDLEERWGGHVRAGYTLDSYRQLLCPLGFEITTSESFGGAGLAWAMAQVFKMEDRFGGFSPPMLAALPLFAFVWLDHGEPSCPYSIYVRAEKPAR